MGGGGGDDVEPKESAQERELARISKEQIDRWWNVGRPAQMEWVEDGMVDNTDRSLMRGQVGANVSQQAQQQRGQLQSQQMRRGLSPTGGASVMGKSGLEQQTGEIGSNAQTSGQHAMTNKNMGHLMNATAVMRGEAVDAQSGLTTLADRATQDSITDARVNYVNNQSEGSDVGAAVGMGLNGLESWVTDKYGNKKGG